MIIRVVLVLILSLSMTTCCLNCANKGDSSKGCPRKAYDNTKLKAGQLNFRMPNSWQQTQPGNPMRLAEYIIDPTTQTAVSVYFFQGMKNAVEPNLKRWKDQFKDNEARKLLEKKQFNNKGLPTTLYHITGTYLKKERPMELDSPKLELEDHSLLGAVVELKDGTWFFKTYGPRSVIESQRDKFGELVGSFSIEKS